MVSPTSWTHCTTLFSPLGSLEPGIDIGKQRERNEWGVNSYWFRSEYWRVSDLLVEQTASVGPVLHVVALWESLWTLYKNRDQISYNNRSINVKTSHFNLHIGFLHVFWVLNSSQNIHFSWSTYLCFFFLDIIITEGYSIPLGPNRFIIVPTWNRKKELKLQTSTLDSVCKDLCTPTLTCWSGVLGLDWFWHWGEDIQWESVCREKTRVERKNI